MRLKRNNLFTCLSRTCEYSNAASCGEGGVISFKSAYPLLTRSLRVAVVHDWLVVNGGAERTLARMLECFPQAEVFTLVDFLPPEERRFLGDRPVHTSFLQRLPAARRHYRQLLPLMPVSFPMTIRSVKRARLSLRSCTSLWVFQAPFSILLA